MAPEEDYEGLDEVAAQLLSEGDAELAADILRSGEDVGPHLRDVLATMLRGDTSENGTTLKITKEGTGSDGGKIAKPLTHKMNKIKAAAAVENAIRDGAARTQEEAIFQVADKLNLGEEFVRKASQWRRQTLKKKGK